MIRDWSEDVSQWSEWESVCNYKKESSPAWLDQQHLILESQTHFLLNHRQHQQTKTNVRTILPRHPWLIYSCPQRILSSDWLITSHNSQYWSLIGQIYAYRDTRNSLNVRWIMSGPPPPPPPRVDSHPDHSRKIWRKTETSEQQTQSTFHTSRYSTPETFIFIFY